MSRKKIAIIEDDDDNRDMLAACMSARYEVALYPNGPAGLKGIREDCPDAVLMDIAMPDIDGISILQEMRSDAALRYVPVIAVTARAMRGDKAKYLAAGFDDYFAKPIYDIEELRQAVQTQIGINRE